MLRAERFLVNFAPLDRARLEVGIASRPIGIDAAPLNPDGLIAQHDMFLHRSFDDVAADPHATPFNRPLADTKLFLNDRNMLFPAGIDIAQFRGGGTKAGTGIGTSG